jgi:hypothetical protein
MKTINSPLEDVFDIESGTTMSLIQTDSHDNFPTPVSDDPNAPLDAEDNKVSRQLDTVYDYALESFEAQHALQQTVDPKFAARNAEVAAQFLKIALDATEARAKNKMERDKLRSTIPKGPGTVNNNVIVTDRRSVLSALKDLKNRGSSASNIIDIIPDDFEE